MVSIVYVIMPPQDTRNKINYLQTTDHIFFSPSSREEVPLQEKRALHLYLCLLHYKCGLMVAFFFVPWRELNLVERLGVLVSLIASIKSNLRTDNRY